MRRGGLRTTIAALLALALVSAPAAVSALEPMAEGEAPGSDPLASQLIEETEQASSETEEGLAVDDAAGNESAEHESEQPGLAAKGGSDGDARSEKGEAAPENDEAEPENDNDEGAGESEEEPEEEPEEVEEPKLKFEVDNAVFTWGINRETTGGAYYGGCNFLSAGIAGDAGSSRIWKKEDNFYLTEEGNVKVQRPSANGKSMMMPSWDQRCDTPKGVKVNGKTTNAADSSTDTVIRIEGGKGKLDTEANTAEIRWKGSFTVAYYGGMTYWSATDPVLKVDAKGRGTVTAQLSGFGADMDDPEVWSVLPKRTITLAKLTGVNVTAKGIETTPDFLGVKSSVVGRNPQSAKSSANAAWWGSFPSDFIQYHLLTGQSSYWYTTDGGPNTIQPRKVALPIRVTFEEADQSEPEASLPAKTAAVEWTQTALIPHIGGGSNGRQFEWQKRDPKGEWKKLKGETQQTLTLMPLLSDNGTEYRVRVTTMFGTVLSKPTQLAVSKKKPGSIVPRTGPELSDKTKLGSLGDVEAHVADGSVRDLTKQAKGVSKPLDVKKSHKITVPWKGKASSGEAWLYPGQRYLGEWKADRKTNTATFTLAPGTEKEGARVLGSLQDGQDYSLLFFTHDDPVSRVSFTVKGSKGAGDTELSNAGLRWGINTEATGGAYFGGCNFLSAGAAGDTGSARVWTKADGLFQNSSNGGKVRIEKPNSAGKWGPVTWDNKCKDPFGKTVTSNSTESTSGAEIVLTGGTGSVDAAGNNATLRWSGSFTVVFYGGMTYWTASNPELTVRNGVGTLTATGSGFAADMDDTSVWKELEPRRITLATFSNVKVDAANFTIAPDYLGVSVGDLSGGRNAQPKRTEQNKAFWGSFPRDFINFQIMTGQSSYWYTSDGARDRAKLPSPINVCADAANCEGSVAPPKEPEQLILKQNAIKPPPARPASTVVTKQPIALVTQVSAPLAQAVDDIKRTIMTTRIIENAPVNDQREVLLLMLVFIAGSGLVVVVSATGGALIQRGVIRL